MYSESGARYAGEGWTVEHEMALTLRDVALACVGRLLFAREDVAPFGVSRVTSSTTTNRCATSPT